MKKVISLTLFVAGLSAAFAQGTFQLRATLNGANEVPPNSSPGIGSGILTLSGTTLNYDFFGPNLFSGGQGASQATDATINGPASPGSTAPILFDLGAPTITPIQPPPGSAFTWQGTINNLTGSQITDLMAGLWYVNVFTSSGTFPNGEIRGQILEVPEPSALALFGLVGALALIRRRTMSRRQT
jgi:hypothetical protein